TILVVANLSGRSQPVSLDLARYHGTVPMELLGETRFPPITDQPYFLSLGPHGFYWFRLEPRTRRPQRYGIEDAAISTPRRVAPPSAVVRDEDAANREHYDPRRAAAGVGGHRDRRGRACWRRRGSVRRGAGPRGPRGDRRDCRRLRRPGILPCPVRR